MDENKKIMIEGTSNRYQIKKLIEKKEKKQRQITKTWNITSTELSYSYQIKLIHKILLLKTEGEQEEEREEINKIEETEEDSGEVDEIKEMNTAVYTLTINHLKTKLAGYRHQDILKKVFEPSKIISYDKLLEFLVKCELKCQYCSRELFLLYEFVREGNQWTLDRIDNNIGHNYDNVLISCLECNLKRKVINKDRFFFTKNMKITREGI